MDRFFARMNDKSQTTSRRQVLKFGVAAALYTSAALHVVMLVLLVMVARMSGLGWIALGGLVAVAALLAYEHLLVKPSDLSRVNAAFFTMNGVISVVFFAFIAGDLLAKH